MTKNFLLGICLIVAAYLLGDSFYDAKKLDNIRNMTIEVKGYASKNIESDFADWTGSFSVRSQNLQDAYSQLNIVKVKVEEQLKKLGAKDGQMKFSALETIKIFNEVTTPNGYQQTSEVIAYELMQTVSIESNDINIIEKISKLSTNLISEGINFYSYAPRYFYTRIDNLKLQMLAEAAKDAKNRAEQLAENTDADVGNLISASQGIFQINPKNSQEVSDYGIYDTSTKLKTISAVITAQFEVK